MSDVCRVHGYAFLTLLGSTEIMVNVNAPIHVTAPWSGNHNVVMLATEWLSCFVPVESFGRLIGW